jgi:hypothetical protein
MAQMEVYVRSDWPVSRRRRDPAEFVLLSEALTWGYAGSLPEGPPQGLHEPYEEVLMQPNRPKPPYGERYLCQISPNEPYTRRHFCQQAAIRASIGRLGALLTRKRRPPASTDSCPSRCENETVLSTTPTNCWKTRPSACWPPCSDPDRAPTWQWCPAQPLRSRPSTNR